MLQLTSCLQEKGLLTVIVFHSLWLVKLLVLKENLYTGISVVQCMQGEYIAIDDCCYYILACYRVQGFNSTHSRMRSLIAWHIVQRLSSKRVRQIEIRVRGHVGRAEMALPEVAFLRHHQVALPPSEAEDENGRSFQRPKDSLHKVVFGSG